MKTILLIFSMMMTIASSARAQDLSIGIFNHSSDVGNPAVKGSSSYDQESQVYTLKGAGYNIWFNRDEFHFLPQ
jgi:TolB protein